MRLLSRYLVRQNLFLTCTILLVGTGLYVLTDMFERLDNFLESGATFSMVLVYYTTKLPIIVSQILPAVYLIALVAQFNFLERSRELIALTAGGISPVTLVRFVLIYGLMWALIQFLFAQVLGVAGERVSTRIWQENVKGRILEEATINGLWFTQKNRVVHIGKAYPVQERGEDVLIYTLDDTGIAIEEIIKARRFSISADGVWMLEDGMRLIPADYSATQFPRMEMPLHQNLQAFQVSTQTGMRPNQLSLLELREAIQRLESAGSNVESLRTAWHGKISYACSIVVMGVLALLISRQTSSIYKAVAFSLLIVFFYYGTNTMCTAMGERGLLIPAVGAWFANASFFIVGVLCLSWSAIRRRVG